jgi:TATA-box binding protein (TBP) (component of TFIID and TFIIIB)
LQSGGHAQRSCTAPRHSYINLERIHEDLRCSHYDRKRFAAITIRIDHPTVTALLFTSGRLVITGSKCW